MTTEVTQLLNTMEVPTNKTDILKLFDKMNKDEDGTLDGSASDDHQFDYTYQKGLGLRIDWD